MMAERFNIECEDGPHPGLYHTDSDHQEWPLPGMISDSGGKYVKCWESDDDGRPTGESRPYIRYARYKWMTNEQLAQDAR